MWVFVGGLRASFFQCCQPVGRVAFLTLELLYFAAMEIYKHCMVVSSVPVLMDAQSTLIFLWDMVVESPHR